MKLKLTIQQAAETVAFLQRGPTLLLIAFLVTLTAMVAHAQTRELIDGVGHTAETMASMETQQLLAFICLGELAALCFVVWMNARLGFRMGVDIGRILMKLNDMDPTQRTKMEDES